jgi:glycosyltransferase involved in cell wall biosynthesis
MMFLQNLLRFSPAGTPYPVKPVVAPRFDPVEVRKAARDHNRQDGIAIHVLQPSAFDGLGPSQTCLNIGEAAGRSGAKVTIFGVRRRVPKPRNCDLRTPIWNVGSVLPYRRSAAFLSRFADAHILGNVPAGSVTHVWGSLPVQTFRQIKRRNCLVAFEMINIATPSERRIIEHEMDREGFHYDHYVTDEKIAKQAEILDGADLVFASNQFAVDSLLELGLPRHRIVSTRYGTAFRSRRLSYETKRPVFAFVGRINLEKGVHHLLRAWHRAEIDGELQLYGTVDQGFYRQYASLFDHPSIRIMGFCRDIISRYKSVDAFIFLSLAEGGPLVSIEAAATGLPMIVSPMGGGRIAEHGRTALVVAPDDTAEVAAAIRRLARSVALRRQLGEAAHEESADFTWDRAARERLTAIRALA